MTDFEFTQMIVTYFCNQLKNYYSNALDCPDFEKRKKRPDVQYSIFCFRGDKKTDRSNASTMTNFFHAALYDTAKEHKLVLMSEPPTEKKKCGGNKSGSGDYLVYFRQDKEPLAYIEFENQTNPPKHETNMSKIKTEQTKGNICILCKQAQKNELKNPEKLIQGHYLHKPIFLVLYYDEYVKCHGKPYPKETLTHIHAYCKNSGGNLKKISRFSCPQKNNTSCKLCEYYV